MNGKKNKLWSLARQSCCDLFKKYETINCQNLYEKKNYSFKWVAVIQLNQNYNFLKFLVRIYRQSKITSNE